MAAKPKAITNAPSQHPNAIRKLRYIRIQVYLHCVGCGLAGAQAHHSRRRAAAGIEEEVAVYFRTTRSNLLEIVLIRACLYGPDACADFTQKSPRALP